MIHEKIIDGLRWDINKLKINDIPTTKGIYCYLDKVTLAIQYVGSAVGVKGLRGRIWSQHLNPDYLESRKEKFSSKDSEQIKKQIKKNGKIVIEKSAFRKNLARKHNLTPGVPCLEFLKENFLLVFFPLDEHSTEKIHEIEKDIINNLAPKYNIRNY
ncbi:hypothetical protein GF1_05210 [Desulfolithobacter dissulfuricans]|uniref:Uncharacterized protein n=1 Tax=Desulfolithobacter dissulfuricans TaxID=2795293 RepID=A0A915TZJ9_9BACT|nr:hypothetical protein [Desulfolithobacter dissulfuricans]BCO08145.1 hypothetical protein GF1_05210 [Desulfolithobacter dissulfuricans]